MSGIAGILDLTGTRPLPESVLQRMAGAMVHRGPDGASLWAEPGLGLAFRRLGTGESVNPVLPAGDEKRLVTVLLDGRIYNGAELRADLEQRGHRLSTECDGQLIAHLWQQYAEGLLDRLRGQFAIALWDRSQRRLILARDRLGISPLHWSRQGDWLLFASEIKALLASGMVEAKPDLRGISQVFTFFGLPGPVTCFQGVSALVPGHYLDIRGANGVAATVCDRAFWQMDFPDRGQEEAGTNQGDLLERYDHLLLRSVQRRLCGSRTVAAYSSGGLDSSLLATMASQVRGEPLETFTFQIEHPTLHESSGAEILGSHLGREPRVLALGPDQVLRGFPELVAATESPVIDASAAALYRLAEEAHACGYKSVLTGEGADEWQAGYPWFRIDRKLAMLDLVPGLAVNRRAFWRYVQAVHWPRYTWSEIRRAERAAGGHNAWLLAYHLMSVSKHRFFSGPMKAALGDYLPYDDLGLDTERMARWHPLNRSICVGVRIHLPGLHFQARGDRSTMHASVQPRYPFLDEDLVDFLARLHPRWKIRRGEDKYLERRLADRRLPAALTAGRKRLLHAPLDAFHRASPPAWLDQLLSRESLARAGYFDAEEVHRWRRRLPAMRKGYRRLFVEMGLLGVVSTQLWHQAYLDPTLADVSPRGAHRECDG